MISKEPVQRASISKLWYSTERKVWLTDGACSVSAEAFIVFMEYLAFKHTLNILKPL